MTLTLLLGLVVAVGLVIALVSPGLARVLGWIVVAGTLVACVAIFRFFTAGGTSELPGQILLIVGLVVVCLVALLGGALAFGLLGGRSAAATAVSAGIEGFDNEDSTAAHSLAVAGASRSYPSQADGILGARASRHSSEIGQLVQGFVSGLRPNASDLLELAKAAVTERRIPLLADRIRGDTLLHWCVRLDQPDVAASLLLSGANSEARNGQGLAALAGASADFLARLDKAKQKYSRIQ